LNEIPRTAVLLAAGCARRLGELTNDRPKCLLEVGGKALIEHQIDALRGLGVDDVLVVTGFCAEQVESRLGDRARYVRNDVYDTTNSLFSLHLALAEVPGAFVLTNADVLFHPDLLSRLLRAKAGDALLYEASRQLGDEEMKIRLDGEFVTALAKTLPQGTYHGENLGVLKFSARGRELLYAAASDLVARGDVNAWAPKALDAIASRLQIAAIPTAGLPWIEIDFPADLERARVEVWPKLAARRAGVASGGEG
jgi:choline kinase